MDNPAAAICHARRREGLTQEELGEAIGKPRQYIADIERGKTLPDDELVFRLAARLRLDGVELAMQVWFARLGAVPVGAGEPWDELTESLFAGRSAESTIPRVAPKKNQELFDSAHQLADLLFGRSIKNGRAVPVVRALDDLDRVKEASGVGSPMRLEVYGALTDGRLSEEGRTSYHEGTLVIGVREDIWQLASAGEGRARFTLAHELGHAVLHENELRAAPGAEMFRDTLCSAIRRSAAVRPFECPEHQANVWAGAFLVPLVAVKEFLAQRDEAAEDCSIEDLARNFGVTRAAARVRLNQLLPRLATRS